MSMLPNKEPIPIPKKPCPKCGNVGGLLWIGVQPDYSIIKDSVVCICSKCNQQVTIDADKLGD